MAAKTRVEVEVDGRRLSLSNLDKVMYPSVGFTKGAVVDYYTRVAPALLPHLSGRPLTLKRYPDGVDGKHFYEKQCPSHRPDWVRTTPVPVRHRTIDFCLAGDLPTLVWLANLADLELHPSLSRVPDLDRPTWLVFDLDPGPPATIVDCAGIALRIRKLLGTLGLESFAKTSGSKGMQLYAPLNTGGETYDETKPFAKAVAQLLERETPKEATATMAKDQRAGKVFVDWSQNDESKTTIAAYSLRATADPSVSTPLRWPEVEALADGGDPATVRFGPPELLERVEEIGDPLADALTLEQKLPALET